MNEKLKNGDTVDLKRLKQAETQFLRRYPGGFEHPEMLELVKKHTKAKLTQFTQESFAKKNLNDPEEIVSSMITVVTRSSMISVFEKPRFRDAIRELPGSSRLTIAQALRKLLYGKQQQQGFEMLLDELTKVKLAKWTLMTVVQAYYKPDYEVFIKPTTTKNIISNLKLDLVYKPRPSWEFYSAYREIINELKPKVDPSLSPSNPAFCGFMMMVFDEAWDSRR